MDKENGWILKILTGPHVGSEAILSSGVYLLGRDEHCDIILHDTSLEEQHFQIIINEDKVSLGILSKDRPCYLDGEKIDSDSIEIKPYQVVSTGTLFFALGHAREAWPPIELLGAGRNFKQAEDKVIEETPEDDNPQPSSSSSPSPIPAAWQQLWRSDRPANRIYLSVGIALIGIGLSLLFVVFTTAEIPGENLETQTVEINQIIEEYVIDAKVNTVYRDGQEMLYIQGYTDTDERRAAFMEALGKAKITAQTQLYSAQRIKLATSVILGQILNPQTDKVEVSSVPGSPGKVGLSGYVEKSEVWERALGVIKDDVQGLQGYDNQVRTMDDAMYELNQMLAAQELSDKVSLNVDKNTIYLVWQTLSNHEQQQLKTLVENFRKKFDNQPPLADIDQGKSEINKFDPNINLQSVSFGEAVYLETQDGKRYTIGAILGDSYTIKEINREFILLSKDGELGRYYFNDRKTAD